MEIKDQVKNAVSIVDVASLYVDLKPVGKNYKALCPFHREKTPSFYVMPEKGTFTCYGCHAYGDIFTLIQQMEALTFPEALKFLIERYHLPLDPRRQGQKSPQEPGKELEKINSLALHYFQQQLWDSEEGEPARSYLEKRGITQETMRSFSLGLAPNQWDGLRNHLEKQGLPLNQCIDSGLLASSEQGRVYDRFRNRIIIPILSMNGAVLAFGGRALDDQPAKYINSPETPLYKKGHHLFAFNLARQHIRSERSLILVEGYFDQISLFQNGIRNVTASLGTALTDEQAYLIKRFSDRVYICYDSDSAGQKAAASAVEKLLSHQVSSRVVQLRSAKDPDELVRKLGPETFREQMKQGIEGFRFLLQRLSESEDLRDPLSKSRAMQNLAPVIQKVDDRLVRLDLLKKCEDFFDIPFSEIKRLFPTVRDEKDRGNNGSPNLTLGEADFLKVLLSYPEKIVQVRPLLEKDLLASLSIGRILETMLRDDLGAAPEGTDSILVTSRLMSRLDEGERRLVQQLTEQNFAPCSSPEEADAILEQSMLLFVDRLNRKRIDMLNRQIHMAEQNGETTKIHELMQKKNQFIKTIRHNRQKTPRSCEGTLRRS